MEHTSTELSEHKKELPAEGEHRLGSTGSVIAILLIVMLLVIGAFYVWGQRLAEQRAEYYVPAIEQ